MHTFYLCFVIVLTDTEGIGWHGMFLLLGNVVDSVWDFMSTLQVELKWHDTSLLRIPLYLGKQEDPAQH